MRFDEPFADVQSKAESWNVTAARCSATCESLKQRWYLCGWNPLSSVDDRDLELRSLRRKFDGDLALWLTVLDSVRNQITEHLLEPCRIHPCRRWSGVNSQPNTTPWHQR